MSGRYLDRRRFVKTASAGVVAATAFGTTHVPAQSGTPKVLIIGAGMSGIAASYQLRKFGISSLVLEGRDRIGGRLWSSRYWPDAVLDLGGAWIHDSLNSPLTPIAKRYGIQTKYTDDVNSTASLPNGKKLRDVQVADVAATFGFVLAKTAAEGLVLKLRGVPDQPISNVVNRILVKLPVPPAILGGINTLIDATIRSVGGAELSDLSLYHFGEDSNLVGVQDLMLPQGYVQLVERLADGQQVLYGQIVQRVLYSQQGVTVVTNRGRFSAKYALITLPLGVLRAKAVDFVPQLPGWKQAAIDRLQTGVWDKLFLRFPHAFWDTTKTFLFRTQPPTDRFVWWFNAALITGKPILGAFVTADVARTLEPLPDTEVIRQLMGVLRPWFPDQQIPNPIDFQRSRWASDPFANGVYPHLPLGATPADYDVMSLPVPYAANLPPTGNRLFFAGDATHRQHPCSVWGAYESGLREANRIRLSGQ